MIKRGTDLTFPELFNLPATVDMHTAACALGICVNTAYRLAKRGCFPCLIFRPGWRYRIPTAALMQVLGVDGGKVDMADVNRAIDDAAGSYPAPRMA
ncbi:hypothetical protein BJF85_14615 [Saccharomonospora sp. CUA-673]|uniref:helix-turn-helix domain-containing protein n=1 Tax=Saccharomonospora sp. CUA-673 TaxID=1904969 RepID=UPI00095AD123|nr:helix-turn-helix domain-containing protein [Saccharomonospora sp. CUA-673]OLT47856.1 hypothetical protein BJF85_14615 [Saccharomonospora sp. CUA-673]